MVQNHLTILVRGLDNYTLYAHGSDPCHNSELTHAMANCFKSLMGASFLDGGTATGINSVYLSRLFFDQFKYVLQNKIFQYSNLCSLFHQFIFLTCHGIHILVTVTCVQVLVLSIAQWSQPRQGRNRSQRIAAWSELSSSHSI